MNSRVWIEALVWRSGEIAEEALPWLKQKKFLKVMNAEARLALAAMRALFAQNAFENVEKESWGVALSLAAVDSGANDWVRARDALRAAKGGDEPGTYEVGQSLPPLALIPRLPNTMAGHVARELGATGPCWTSGGDYPGGMDVILQGARWIADGECRKAVLVRVEEGRAMAMLLAAEKPMTALWEITAWCTKNDPGAGRRTEILELSDMEKWARMKAGGVLESGWKHAPAQIVLQ